MSIKSDAGGYVFLFIIILIWAGISRSCDFINATKREKALKIEFENALDIDTEAEYKRFLQNVEYKYKEKYEAKLDSVLWARAVKSSDYSNYLRVSTAIKLYSSKRNPARDSLDEQIWRESLIINDFEYYIVKSKYLEGKYKTVALANIKRNDSISWLTDTTAWKRALKIDSSRVYKKYIDLFPQGKNIQEANQLVVDKRIDEIFKSKHGYGALPSMEKTSAGSGTTARIGIYNNTPYTLTLCYSGPTKKIVYIESQKTTNVILANGEYKIGASVDKYGVRNFAGSESINGGNYEVQYYIVTTTN